MAWGLTDARFRLRTQLGDLPTDKFIFKTLAYPSPDGINIHFHTGETKLVVDSLTVQVSGSPAVSGTPYAVSGTPNWADGTFKLNSPPPSSTEIHCTFHHQWFDDAQLDSFLESAVNSLGVETVGDETLPIGLRAAALLFAAYFAYMNKAGQVASVLDVEAEGYQVDQSKSFPNWKKLAENAWKQALEALKLYNDNILLTGGVGLAWTSYRLPRYVPGS